MDILTHIRFDATDAAPTLPGLSKGDLDSLDFGVIEMNRACEVLRYNATELRYAGLPLECVVGRHFFRAVTPCANSRHVAQRYDDPVLDETLKYSSAPRIEPVPANLRLIKPAGEGPTYLLVRWT